MVAAAYKELRRLFEADGLTKGLPEFMEPHYKTASIFVRYKAWAKVDTSEFKVFVLTGKKSTRIFTRSWMCGRKQ
jgi:hypothetical protein